MTSGGNRLATTAADVTVPEVSRIRRFSARNFSISAAEATRRFTKKGEDKGEIVLRHQKDEHFGTACQFLDLETRRCTVYEARPAVCREFPGAVRCGYYDFLSFERRTQEDPEYVSSTWNK